MFFLDECAYILKNKGWPYIVQLDACLDAPNVVSLDRLQLGACLDALTAVSVGS